MLGALPFSLGRGIGLWIAVLAASGCGSGSAAQPPVTAPPGLTPPPAPGGTLRVLVGRDPAPFDPAFAVTRAQREVAFVTCTPLLTYADAPGTAGATIVPGLADDLPIVSRNARSYTFRLRAGLRFADGRPLTTADVRATFERLVDPRLGSPARAVFADLAGIARFLDGRTPHLAGVSISARDVAFHLRAPDRSFLARLALPYACPTPQGTPLRAVPGLLRPAASGPYRLGRHVAGRSFDLVRNPAYRPVLLGARGQVARVEGRIGVAPLAAVRAVQSSEADLSLDGVPGGVDPAGVVGAPSGAMAVLRLDVSSRPFDRLAARQAVALAVDRTAAARLAGGPAAATPTAGILPRLYPGYRAATDWPLVAAPAKARSALLAVGASLPVRTTLWAPASPTLVAVARRVRQDLARAGIDAALRVGGAPPRGGVRLQLAAPPYVDPAAVLRAQLAAAPRGAATDALLRAYRSLRPVSGDARSAALGRLVLRLLRGELPAAVLFETSFRALPSPRVRSMLLHPVYGVDLAAIAVRR